MKKPKMFNGKHKETASSNITIGRRIFTSFILVVSIPVMLTWILSGVSFYIDTEQNSREYTQRIAQQITTSISYTMDDYVNKLNRIASNNSIRYQLYNLQSERSGSYSPYTVVEAVSTIIDNTPGIDSVEICAKTSARVCYNSYITKGTVADSPLLTKTSTNGGITWNVQKKELANDPNTYIILSKKIYYDSSFDDVAGYALIAIDRNYLDQLCRYNETVDGLYVFVTNENGAIISHPDKNKMGTQVFSQAKNYIRTLDEESIRTISTKIDNQTSLVSYSRLDSNGWYIFSVIPSSYFMSNMIFTSFISLIVVLAFLGFSIVLARRITRSIALPIQSLVDSMGKVGRGDFHQVLDTSMDKAYKYTEFVQLENGFVKMQNRLSNLINEVAQYKVNENKLVFLKTEAELNALQQQINPHFLYNTLESIYWTAYSKGETEIAEMITALGNFFRTSINRGLEYITVEDEIKNIQNYVYLQRIRYNERFSVQWDIDDDILNYKIIKLILQPIIENAIVHGIEELPSDGLIVVKGYKKEDTLLFEIIDNGPGMEKEKVDYLNKYINSSEKDPSGSIGVRNVNQRIKLYYGEEYGIEMQSTPGKGTRVILKLPVTLTGSRTAEIQ